MNKKIRRLIQKICKRIFLCFGHTGQDSNLCVFSLVFVLGSLVAADSHIILFPFFFLFILSLIFTLNISNNSHKKILLFWWCLQVRTFRGHTNEKNFVGLTVNSEYIACGSETNEVFVYHKVSKI